MQEVDGATLPIGELTNDGERARKQSSNCPAADILAAFRGICSPLRRHVSRSREPHAQNIEVSRCAT